MAISIFPSTAAEFVSNNFVIDMNDTSNNSVTLENVKQAGTYNISIESGDTSFDIYLLDNDGALVAYTNTTTVAPTGLFQIVVVLGVADSEIISFSYAGNVNNADGEGDQPGAAAYLTSITPSDLPSIDDTATVVGGNFGADTEIKFESGATVLDAKNITVNNSNELIVTRPDNLDADLNPWTVRAITAGVPEPTGSDSNLLVDELTAGTDPTWITTSPLNDAIPNQAFSQTLEATDSESTVVYSVTSGTITPGLSLDSSTGVLSGTPTTVGDYTFTVTASDDGGNETPREFAQSVKVSVTGGTTTTDGGFVYHTFTTTDDFVVDGGDITADVLIVAGGGGGANGNSGGGGGAGGMLELDSITITPGTYTALVGAGGNGGSSSGSTQLNTSGADSQFGALGTAVGGGRGALENPEFPGASGGSGGGSIDGLPVYSGVSGQGQEGGASPNSDYGAGGGGRSQPGASANGETDAADGGDGKTWLDGTTYAGGGAGGSFSGNVDDGGAGGGGSSGRFSNQFGGVSATPGVDGLGGGGGGGWSDNQPVSSGGNGIVIVRFAE